ncbi:MAG: hypothetical protein PHY30_02625 [Candidatus Pacebacteria bacterium]|nr:hypothetical protein [Candidatus Paceibacterota bacterium]
MKKRYIALTLSLISLAIFVYEKINAEGNENLNRNVQIIDNREVVENNSKEESIDKDIVVFGNDYGEMCLDLKTFLDEEGYEYTSHLPSSPDFYNKIEEYKKMYGKSQGLSSNFKYYPIVFVGDQAFSGFDNITKEEIKEAILNCEKDSIDI